MFWKLFALSWVLPRRSHLPSLPRMTLDMSVAFADPHPGSSPKPPRDFRRNVPPVNVSDVLEEILVKKQAQKKHTLFSSGRDGRPPVTPNPETTDADIIFNITRFTHQMSLLRVLENANVSVPDKQAAIADYEKTAQDTTYLPQIHRGGLWKHWHNDEGDEL